MQLKQNVKDKIPASRVNLQGASGTLDNDGKSKLTNVEKKDLDQTVPKVDVLMQNMKALSAFKTYEHITSKEASTLREKVFESISRLMIEAQTLGQHGASVDYASYMWKLCFYMPISAMRKELLRVINIEKKSNGSSDTDSMAAEGNKLTQQLNGFISESIGQLKNLANSLEGKLKKASYDETRKAIYRNSLYVCWRSLGDVARYRDQVLTVLLDFKSSSRLLGSQSEVSLKQIRAKLFVESRLFYFKALDVSPESGMVYNQLATISQEKAHYLQTLAFYLRAEYSPKPFPMVEKNLKLFLRKCIMTFQKPAINFLMCPKEEILRFDYKSKKEIRQQFLFLVLHTLGRGVLTQGNAENSTGFATQCDFDVVLESLLSLGMLAKDLRDCLLTAVIYILEVLGTTDMKNLAFNLMKAVMGYCNKVLRTLKKKSLSEVPSATLAKLAPLSQLSIFCSFLECSGKNSQWANEIDEFKKACILEKSVIEFLVLSDKKPLDEDKGVYPLEDYEFSTYTLYESKESIKYGDRDHALVGRSALAFRLKRIINFTGGFSTPAKSDEDDDFEEEILWVPDPDMSVETEEIEPTMDGKAIVSDESQKTEPISETTYLTVARGIDEQSTRNVVSSPPRHPLLSEGFLTGYDEGFYEFEKDFEARLLDKLTSPYKNDDLP